MMALNGTIKGRTVELEGNVPYPDGTRVRVLPEAEVLDQPDNKLSLGEWIEQARKFRETLPITEDSTEILRQIREERASR